VWGCAFVAQPARAREHACRNNLNKILETPYSSQNWKIELHRVGDVVVMDVRKGEFLSQSSAHSLKMQYWGHKFEACCGGSDAVDVESEW
jgi:hypothetical protein